MEALKCCYRPKYSGPKISRANHFLSWKDNLKDEVLNLFLMPFVNISFLNNDIGKLEGFGINWNSLSTSLRRGLFLKYFLVLTPKVPKTRVKAEVAQSINTSSKFRTGLLIT